MHINNLLAKNQNYKISVWFFLQKALSCVRARKNSFANGDLGMHHYNDKLPLLLLVQVIYICAFQVHTISLGDSDHGTFTILVGGIVCAASSLAQNPSLDTLFFPTFLRKLMNTRCYKQGKALGPGHYEKKGLHED